MKNIALILLSLIILSSCGSQKSVNDTGTELEFSNLYKNTIESQKEKISGNPILISDDSGMLINKGAILIYQTSEGNYGKMEVLNIDREDNYKLTIKLVTYNNDGSILSQSNNLSIRGTYLCDLDKATESSDSSDFYWSRKTKTITQLSSENNAIFYLLKN